jgi:hypothetical protein
VITGFNTDVEHEGVVYHVQTEDKGLDAPLILSLVYAGGQILASKRAPYDDLISSGFNERALSDRLQRQHKLICAAIRAGRIDDLKRMSQRDSPARVAATSPAVKKRPAAKAQLAPPASLVAPEASSPAVETGAKEQAAPQRSAQQTVRALMQQTVADFARTEGASDALHVSLLDEVELRGGMRVELRIGVGCGEGGREAIADAEVTVKVLGSTFRPLIYPARTGMDGIALIRMELPHFKTGRAAILVRAVANGFEAELRRIIQQG